jgi:hypothetical protein
LTETEETAHVLAEEILEVSLGN